MKSQTFLCSSLIGFVVLSFASMAILAPGGSKQDTDSFDSQAMRREVKNSAKENRQRNQLGNLDEFRYGVSVVTPATNVMSAIEMEHAQTNGHSIGKNDIAQIPNPLIDAERFVVAAEESIKLRESRRLTEEQFIETSKEKGVVILDARSRDRYEQVHIQGAMSLPFTDISYDSLAQHLPNKETRILIYCNNNFTGNLPEFAEKRASTSLNLSTFATLYEYGYRNVYELGPALQIDQTKIPLEGTNAKMLTAK